MNPKRWYIVGGLLAVAILAAGAYAAIRSHSASAHLFLTPSSVSATAPNTVAFAIHEDSGSTPVNAVQANLSYDATKLQFVSTSATGSAFGIQAQASGGAGRVTIARATTGGSAPVTGSQLVAQVTFRALAGNGSSSVKFASTSTVVRASGNSGLPVHFGPAQVHFNGGATTASVTPTPQPAAPSHQAAAAASTPNPGAASGSMYLAPAGGTVASGGTISFDIRENSGVNGVNAVQANFSYPADKFEFVSISGSSSAFGLQVQGSGSGGNLVIVRGINPGSQPVTGDQVVATVTLKATGAGSAAVTPAAGSAMVRASNNANILTSTAGATFTLGN